MRLEDSPVQAPIARERRTKNRLRAIALLICLSAASQHAHSAIVTYQATGTISTFSGDISALSGQLGFQPAVGASVVLTFNVDTNTPASGVFGTFSAEYAGALLSVSATVQGASQLGTISIPIPPGNTGLIGVGEASGVIIENNAVSQPDMQYLTGYMAEVNPVAVATGYITGMQFATVAGNLSPLALYSSTSLSNAPLPSSVANFQDDFSLTDASYLNGRFQSQGIITATITSGASPVPLPASAWLLLSAIGGLGIVARRQLAA